MSPARQILFDHFGRLIEDLGGSRDADLLRCLEIDEQLKLQLRDLTSPTAAIPDDFSGFVFRKPLAAEVASRIDPVGGGFELSPWNRSTMENSWPRPTISVYIHSNF